MTFELRHIPKDELTNFEEILIFREDNPHTYEFVAHSRLFGMVYGKMVSAAPVRDYRKIVEHLDEAAGNARGLCSEFWKSLKDETISRDLEHTLFHELIYGTAQDTSCSGWEAFAREVAGMVRRAMPEEAIRVFQRNSLYLNCVGSVEIPYADDETSTADVLAYFTGGDKMARLQAAVSYPLCLIDLMRDPEFLEALDNGKKINPLIRSRLGLTPTQMRVFRRFEGVLARVAFDKDNPQGIDKALRIVSSDGKIEDEPDADDLDHLGEALMAQFYYSSLDIMETAKGAARVIWLDQISPPSEEGDLDTLYALRAHRFASNIASRFGTGFAPFERMMKRVRAGQWGEASDRIIGMEEKLSECVDYFDNITRNILTVATFETVRRSGVFDMAGIAGISEKLISDQPLAEDEAELIQSYFDVFGHRMSELRFADIGLRKTICEMKSLKDVLELNTRWHHKMGAIESTLMSYPVNIMWDALLAGGQLEHEGLICRELTCSDDFTIQGKREKHCVGSYVRIVLGARTHSISLVFSIEEPTGDVLSTAEITGYYDEEAARYVFECSQNMAKGNTTPDRRAELAVKALVRHIQELPVDRIDNYISRLKRDADSLKDTYAYLVNGYGANICNPDLPEVVLENIANVLPKGLRDISAHQWCDMIEDYYRGACQLNPGMTNILHDVRLALETAADRQVGPDQAPTM